MANFQPIGANFRQKGAKVNKFLRVLGVFSGKSETEKGKNEILFYFWGFRGAAFILFCGGGGGVHLGQVVGLFGGYSPFRGVFPYFVRFPALFSVRCP